MADVTVSDSALLIELTVPERVLSLHGPRILIPRAGIRSVHVVDDVLARLRGLRMPGAGIPGIGAIGTWRGTAGGRPFHDFVVVHRAGPGVVITTDAEYDRVLLGSEAPEVLANRLGFGAGRAL